MYRVAALAAGWLAVGVSLAAGVVSAHPLDAAAVSAPVPPPLLYAGAGVTVAATAGLLGWRGVDQVPAPTRTVAHIPREWARPARFAARLVALVVFVVVLAHGVVGPSTPTANLATVVVWPLVLKGLGIVAVLAGSPWRALSPWETLYDLLVAVEDDRLAVLGAYPDRLGSWPAVAGFVLGVGILENLTVATRSPATTAAVAGGYTAVMLVGGVAFGREWFARADALAVLFALLGRVSVLQVSRTRGGLDVELRPPWRGCLAPVRDWSLVAFVVTAVYTVSFDGFTATTAFRSLRFGVVDVVGLGVAGVSLYLAGLAGFLASYALAAGLAARLATDLGWATAARAFAGTVVPIAAAYEVAHNYPFVVANAGQAVAVARDLLLGVGGTVSALGWLPVAAFWGSQVALIVAGHLVGVVAAHRVATRLSVTTPGARRVHAPLVVAMVAYTVVSLWVVSQPLAT